MLASWGTLEVLTRLTVAFVLVIALPDADQEKDLGDEASLVTEEFAIANVSGYAERGSVGGQGARWHRQETVGTDPSEVAVGDLRDLNEFHRCSSEHCRFQILSRAGKEKCNSRGIMPKDEKVCTLRKRLDEPFPTFEGFFSRPGHSGANCGFEKRNV